MSSDPGAPTKYQPKYCDEMLEYFSIDPYREVKKKVRTKDGVHEVEIDIANDFRSFAGFAVQIGVCETTIRNWKKDHPEFARVHNRCKAIQKHFLQVNGLKGLIDKTFGIFTMKNVTNWRDRHPEEKDDINVNVKNDFTIKSEDIMDRIEQIKGKNE